MFEKPAIGSVVTVTTDWTDYFKTFAPNVKRIRKMSGTVVASAGFDKPNTFRLATGNLYYPESVVPLKRVTKMVDGDGNDAKQGEDKNIAKIWQVDGSKGSVYTVTMNNDKWSCTCMGFGFRKMCKHITSCAEELENGCS